MSYTKDRDEFLNIIQQEGLSYQTATKILRYSQTLHRLAVAQCNGDWPADNGERKVEFCPRCQSGFVPSSFKWSNYYEQLDVCTASGKMQHTRMKVCPDCRTSELVKAALPEGFKPVFAGDPRGCVLKIQVPSGRTNDWSKEGICVPVRER